MGLSRPPRTMPLRRRDTFRPGWVTCLAVCALSKVAQADPVDVPAAAHQRALESELTPRLTGDRPALDAPSPHVSGEVVGTVPPRPLPRLLLADPLAPQLPRYASAGVDRLEPHALGGADALRGAEPQRSGLDPSWLPQFPLTDSRRAAHASSSQIAWDEPHGPIFLPLAPHDSFAPPPSTPPPTASSPSAGVVDDRSGWARWNASLAGVTTTVLAFDVVMLWGFTLLPSEFTGWGEPQFNGLKKNFTVGPRVDNDRFLFNYVAHPLAGSEYYMIARNRDLNWWQSMAYSVALSTVFEFLIESTYEQASWQDLWITPVSGTVLGELRWQAKKALENPTTGKPVGTLNKILYVVIDPFDAVYKL